MRHGWVGLEIGAMAMAWQAGGSLPEVKGGLLTCSALLSSAWPSGAALTCTTRVTQPGLALPSDPCLPSSPSPLPQPTPPATSRSGRPTPSSRAQGRGRPSCRTTATLWCTTAAATPRGRQTRSRGRGTCGRHCLAPSTLRTTLREHLEIRVDIPLQRAQCSSRRYIMISLPFLWARRSVLNHFSDLWSF